MIWLASFPRSGNTFFRNILFEVYGIGSSTYHQDPNRALDADWDQQAVIKTHLLPDQLPAHLRTAKAVYLIRDGRDALVSMAHHRKDIVAPGSDFYNNLLMAILANEGSYFGGWSENVRQWTAKADLVIHFADLIEDPIREVEKLRAIMDLPPPKLDKLPSFRDLKFGQPQYGGGQANRLAQQHFRRGKIGSWQDEMPPELHRLFWRIHGPTMQQWGYTEQALPSRDAAPRRILFEASKMFSEDNDGVKRYLVELLAHIRYFAHYLPDWEIDYISGDKIIPFKQAARDFEPEEGDVEQYGPKELLIVRLVSKAKDLATNYLPRPAYRLLRKLYHNKMLVMGLRNTVNRVIRWLHGQEPKADTLALIEEKYDLVHVPLPQHLPWYRKVTKPLVVTVHDLTHRMYADFHTEENIEKAEAGFRMIGQKEAHVIAISQATQRDLQAHYPVPDERIRLIYEGANGKFDRSLQQQPPDRVLAKYGLPTDRPYLLSLSTLEPRKNIESTIRAFCALKEKQPDLDVMLVVAGKKGWKYDAIFTDRQQLSRAGVFFTGFVEDYDLPILYAHAIALCYPSHYEGFGLPLLEAMQCGTPVIYGNNSAMPEVAAGAGIAVNSQDQHAIQAAMQELVENTVLRQELARQAHQKASTFSWLRTALETLDYFDEIISHY
ncbi:MAG: glycosyltransferase [Bacteroidetes bacterium]|nr:MAG: glycosyltransferase [Bacteroidota bacterium]